MYNNTIMYFFRAKVTRHVPLRNMEFVTLLKGSELKSIKINVAKFGGTVINKCTPNVAAVFAIQGILLFVINMIK